MLFMIVLHNPHTKINPGFYLSIISSDIPDTKYDPFPWNYEIVSAKQERIQKNALGNI